MNRYMRSKNSEVRLQWISRFLHSPVFWTGLVTLLRTGGFFLILPLILRKIPSDQIGMWYVFLGIAQFSAIVELGFAPNISRFASYFMGGAEAPRSLGIATPSSLKGQPNLSGLAGLTRMSRRLYPLLALAMGSIMTFGGGLWLYVHFHEAFWNFSIAPAFFLFAMGMTVSMYGYFWISLLFGVDRVRQGQQIFAVGMMLNYLVCAVGLFLGTGLYALALGQIVLALYPRWASRRVIQSDFLKGIASPQSVSWRDLWPMTWRSGLCSFGAYLSLPAMTLVCAQTTGLADTARYGISLQLALVLHSLSGSWMSAIWPRISSMRVRGEIAAVRSLIRVRLAMSAATYFFGAVTACLLAPAALHLFRSKTDFLPLPLLILLMGVVGIDFLMGLGNAILLTGNHVPHLQASMVTGVLAILFAFFLGRWIGLTGIVLAPLCAQCLYNLWNTPRLCWRDLHPENA